MMTPTSTAFVVDDDPAMRDSMKFMFTGTGINVELYATANAFLTSLKPDAHGCAILDLRMPEMDGLELHRRLRAQGTSLPVIILTGHGDVATAVDEMKAGAFDFLSKPVNRETLLERVREAIEVDLKRFDASREAGVIRDRIASLSVRENEIMNYISLGRSNKQIARVLRLSERTIANHRAHIMRKMVALNSADLVRQLAIAGRISPTAPPQVMQPANDLGLAPK